MVNFGINVNNREPLITKKYSIPDMFHMGAEAENLGFDSVWVGDSLLEKPRLDPIATLAVLADRTKKVKLGTACMVTPLRNPIQFGQAWATLDMFSEGRMILGACMAAADDDRGKLQYEVVGLDPRKRSAIFNEHIEVMKMLWKDGVVNYSGDHFNFENVTFETGNEEVPYTPVQENPPIWVISNPSARGNKAVYSPAIQRIVEVGDGWMTCCRAAQPQEYAAQCEAIDLHAREQGRDPKTIHKSYQVTLHISDSKEKAIKDMEEYVGSYYPTQYYNLNEWGPIGSAEDVIEWIETFADIGCETFIMRFGSFDQLGQMQRFADEVLPAFQ
ncbi:LLM class flavin-dependent oxidoreductase [Candidatus Hikarchaeum yamanae]|uniref:LLM class flavin-dependent oxidoreductase n=1 Tax=Candidatus Hikarchaeum yamanae TaxID=2675326 RepID=UPI0039ED3607